MTNPISDSMEMITIKYDKHSMVLIEGLWNFLAAKYRVEDVPWSGGVVRAHNLILDVFLPPERPLGSVTVSDAHQFHLEALLEFVYRGTVTVQRERLDGLLQLAKELDFQMLLDAILTSRPARPKRKATSKRPWEPEIEIFDDEDVIVPVKRRRKRTTVPLWEPEIEILAGGVSAEKNVDAATGLAQLGAVDKALEKHKCPDCDYESKNPDVIKSHHAAIHTKEKPFKCTMCSYATCWKGVLKRHIDMRHSEATAPATRKGDAGGERLVSGDAKVENADVQDSSGRFKCRHCKKGFNLKPHLKSHMVTAHGPGTRSFACNLCEKSFKNRAGLVEHQRIHTKERPYKCPHCPKAFSQWSGRHSHVSRIHTEGPGEFVCDVCNKHFKTRASLQEHQRIHAPVRSYLCPHCGKGFNQTSGLRSHVSRIHDQGQTTTRSFVCDTCGKGCKTKADMVEHQRTHTQERPYKCPHCDRGFNQSSNRNSHVVRVHTEGPGNFVCETCEKRFKTRPGLVEHRRIHTQELPYKCPHCPKGFNQSSGLRSHVARIHGQGVEPGKFDCDTCGRPHRTRAGLVEHQRTHTKERPYKCPHCDKCFSQTSNRTYHVAKAHGQGPAAGIFVCEVCGKQNNSKRCMMAHKRTHAREKTHKCDQCEYACVTAQLLTVHQGVVHGVGISRFVCEQCGKRFCSRSALARHNLTHTKEKPFKCDQCLYACSQKATLKQHVDAVHGAGRFRCETCDKSLHSASLLVAHRRTHTQEKPFGCPHCSHRSSRKEALARHVDAVHGGVPGADKCVCPTCGKSLNSTRHLARHIRTHADSKPKPKAPTPAAPPEDQVPDGHLHLMHGPGPANSVACDICGRRCSSLEELDAHRRAHSFDRPLDLFILQPKLYP